MKSLMILGNDNPMVGVGRGSAVGHLLGGREGVAPTWEMPQLETPTMNEANFCLVGRKWT